MGTKENIGRRIRAIRNQRGLTQEQLAERIERSKNAVSALERGASLPSFETLERLALALGVPLGDFVGWDAPDAGNPKRAEHMARLVATARELSDGDLEAASEIVAILKRRDVEA